MRPAHRARLRRPYVSLRLKLFALSLSLLVIPWIGYRYLNEMESFLRHAKEDALLASARAVARVLHEQPALFAQGGPPLRDAGGTTHLYVRSLSSPIQLDGYPDDWAAYQDRARHYPGTGAAQARNQGFALIAGTRNGYFYALFQVRDDRVVYRAPGADDPRRADHLLIALQAPDGGLQRYALSSTSPGWVGAQRLAAVSESTSEPGSVDPRIRAEWQETSAGYDLELRMPLSMLGNRLSFAIADVDDPVARTVVSTVATAGADSAAQLGTITVPTPAMDRLLRGLERQQGRIWVVDEQQRVLAMAGNLRADEPDTAPDRGVLHGLYRLVLEQPAEDFQDDLSDVSRLQSREVSAALRGKPATRWRRSPDGQATIVSAAYPVWVGDRVVGAAIAEETSRDILLLQNRALEHLLNLSLVVFLIAAGLLLAMASRLARRIRRLRDQAEGAISRDGQVLGGIEASAAADEVGDLSRSFAGLLQRLRQYTRYLETMAGKLSHELRTPLAVVRSSLENLECAGVDEAQRVYTERARGGLVRLEGIVSRMSEATRLEQAFQQAERESFDLAELLAGCVAGYRSAQPQRHFDLQLSPAPVMVQGVPDMLAQLLDKLVANALDFADPDTPVEICLEAGETIVLRVRNQGPPLPADMEGSLFDSMVSVRTRRSAEPHLGLGLYIVRLIAQFHGGQVRAHSTHGPAGAEFLLVLPADGAAPAVDHA